MKVDTTFNHLEDNDHIVHFSKLDEKLLEELKSFSKENNLLIVGSSQRGKTSLMRTLLNDVKKESCLLVDAFDEINIKTDISVKRKNGFYKKDFKNEITRFAINTSTDNPSIKTIFYDDFYGDEIEEIGTFLDSNPDRNVVLTINHENALEGLKMLFKGVMHNSHLNLNKCETTFINKHFKRIVFMNDPKIIFEIKVVENEVILKPI